MLSRDSVRVWTRSSYPYDVDHGVACGRTDRGQAGGALGGLLRVMNSVCDYGSDCACDYGQKSVCDYGHNSV